MKLSKLWALPGWMCLHTCIFRLLSMMGEVAIKYINVFADSTEPVVEHVVLEVVADAAVEPEFVSTVTRRLLLRLK